MCVNLYVFIVYEYIIYIYLYIYIYILIVLLINIYIYIDIYLLDSSFNDMNIENMMCFVEIIRFSG